MTDFNKSLSIAERQNILENFQNVLKRMGGKFVRRYAHKTTTKYYAINSLNIFKLAAAECGLEIEKVTIAWHRESVYLKNITTRHANRSYNKEQTQIELCGRVDYAKAFIPAEAKDDAPANVARFM